MRSETDVGAAKAQLMEDFNRLVGDTEELLRAMATVPGEKARSLRETVQHNLDAAKQRARELHGYAAERTAGAVRATDAYVHENPWRLVGIAALVGFVAGYIVGNREE